MGWAGFVFIMYYTKVRHRCHCVGSLLPPFPRKELRTGNERKCSALEVFGLQNQTDLSVYTADWFNI